MYRYETHMHTNPVSKCAVATVREQLEAYKARGYAGVFVTNHFIDGNIRIEPELPFAERISFYFSDYEEAKRLAPEIGIDVFDGVELSYKGTDFLVYGLHKDWFLAHPEIEQMKKTEELQLMKEAGALIIQAHPYREAAYIDHIRLFPRSVHGVEVYNARRTESENAMALHYANSYGLLHFSGSDSHRLEDGVPYGGMETDTPLRDEQDFIARVLDGRMKPFMLPAE